jgi:hypothetical protein
MSHPFERCDCICHTHVGSVHHCMPCCSTCPRCQVRIKNGWGDKHEAQCQKEDEELDAFVEGVKALKK